MTVADKQRFAAVMGALGVAFDVTVTPQRMGLYFEDLADQPIWALEWAAKEARRRLKWFPKAAELLELARMAPRPLGPRLEPPVERVLLEDLEPPEVARRRLEELARTLNSRFGTGFFVDENQGRPALAGGKRGLR
jgi:hypothetical protein